MRKFALALLLLIAASWIPGTDASAGARPQPWRTEVVPGLTVERVVRSDPNLVLHVARMAAGSKLALRPVLAHDRIGDPTLDREPVSDMCRRAGGIVCINGDFAACQTCRSPYGGVAIDGRVLRSFNPAHAQVSQVNGRLISDMLTWGGALQASYATWTEVPALLGNPPRRVNEQHDQDRLDIGGINIDPVPDGIVLYTPDWGGTTPATPVQVSVSTPVPIGQGSLPVQIVGRHQGAVPLGHDAVLAATGAAAGRLNAFADRWLGSKANEKHLVLTTAITQPASFSMGGHPVLLRGGVKQNWDRANDPKAKGRHPRTLLGWNAAGETLLVTADGRDPGVSDGLTLDEAADLLKSLGATDGINLDGGGSTTFVGPCDSDPCVLNRPSDGRERFVPVALAVVGSHAGLRPVQASGTRLLPPAPPPPEDAASTPHPIVVPAAPAAAAAAASDAALPTAFDPGVTLARFADALGASRAYSARGRGPWSLATPLRPAPGAARWPFAVMAIVLLDAVLALVLSREGRRSRAAE